MGGSPLSSPRGEAADPEARASGPQDELAALHAFLADRSGQSEESWVGRDLSEPVSATPKAAELDLAELDELIGRLERAVWTGGGHRVGQSEVLSVADRLIGGGL